MNNIIVMYTQLLRFSSFYIIGRRNVFPNINSANGRIEQLNDEFPTNSFKAFELKEID